MQTKKVHAEYMRLWRSKNIERVRAIERRSSKKRYYANLTLSREKAKIRASRWRKRNPERVKQILRKYRTSHPDRCRESSKKWRHSNPDKMRKWRLANRKKLNERTRSWRMRNKVQVMEKLMEFRRRFPEKRSAQVAVYEAVRKGKIAKPDNCFKCFKKCKPDAHHHKGYAIKHRLSIIWLCRSCHNKIHKLIF